MRGKSCDSGSSFSTCTFGRLAPAFTACFAVDGIVVAVRITSDAKQNRFIRLIPSLRRWGCVRRVWDLADLFNCVDDARERPKPMSWQVTDAALFLVARYTVSPFERSEVE